MSYDITPRSTVKRLPARASYDRELVHGILDEALVCHVGFATPDGPFVIPTAHWRDGEDLYVHGAAASRMLRQLKQGVDVCVTVTLIDGLVLARSAFHHSLNYRSVMVFGRAELVEDPAAKRAALDAFMAHVAPGRGPTVRPPSDAELAGTLVLRIPITEVSAKTRAGAPKDDEEDMAYPVWAGVVPLKLVAGPPETAPDLQVDAAVPEALKAYARA